MSKLLTEELLRRLTYLESLAPGWLTVEVVNHSKQTEYGHGYAHLFWDSPLNIIGSIAFVFPQDLSNFNLQFFGSGETLPSLSHIGTAGEIQEFAYNHPASVQNALARIQSFALRCLPEGFVPNPDAIDISELKLDLQKIGDLPLMSLLAQCENPQD